MALGYYEIDAENLQVHTLMNVSYKGEALTTDFEQTTRWITSFTPRIQYATEMNQLHVSLKVAFAGSGRHKDLMKPFYKEGEIRKSQGSWQEIEWSDTTGKPFRVLCGEHPSQCTCKLLGIIPSPCKYYSDIDMYNLSGWQFEIRY